MSFYFISCYHLDYGIKSEDVIKFSLRYLKLIERLVPLKAQSGKVFKLTMCQYNYSASYELTMAY